MAAPADSTGCNDPVSACVASPQLQHPPLTLQSLHLSQEASGSLSSSRPHANEEASPSTKAITFCSHHRARRTSPRRLQIRNFIFLILKVVQLSLMHFFISHAFSFPYLPIRVICAPGWTLNYFLSLVDVAPTLSLGCHSREGVPHIPRNKEIQKRKKKKKEGKWSLQAVTSGYNWPLWSLALNELGIPEDFFKPDNALS